MSDAECVACLGQIDTLPERGVGVPRERVIRRGLIGVVGDSDKGRERQGETEREHGRRGKTAAGRDLRTVPALNPPTTQLVPITLIDHFQPPHAKD